MKENNWKKQMKRLCSVFMACFMLMTVLPAWTVQAAAAPTCVKSQTVYCSRYVSEPVDSDNEYSILDLPTSYIYIKNLASNAKITNIKSSNKKIKASSLLGGSFWNVNAICLEPDFEYLMMNGQKLKDGDKSKISFKVKQNGKTYSLSCNITLKKAKSPVKSLKIGSKEYASYFNGKRDKEVKFPTSNFKITAKGEKGYAVAEIRAYYKNNTSKVVKNGGTVNGKNLSTIEIMYRVKTPANYTKPKKWGGAVPSPLYDTIALHIAY